MDVKLWGIRGSLPAPHPPEVIRERLNSALRSLLLGRPTPLTKSDVEAFLSGRTVAQSGGYGGNTACVEVRNGSQSVIIDAGSGIRRLGERLMGGACGAGQGEVHIFFTHFHWDHLIGLPFFLPIFIPGNKIHFYAVQPDLEDCVRGMFRRPLFPVAFEDLRSEICFHALKPRTSLQVNDLKLTPYQLDHPDPCWGYRVEDGKKAYAHCVDTEGTRVSAADLGADLPLYQNADLVLFDAQYTLLEAVEKMNWGHSAAPIGIDIALRENVKHILFAHHDPGASDEKIEDAERQTREYFENYRENAIKSGRSVSDIKWGFAQESQLIHL